MRPLSQIPPVEAQNLEGLLFDLDDTLLDEGRLHEAAYASLFRLRDSGLRLFALTGRPASWGEVIARMWPVDAAIAENGAVAFHERHGRLLSFDNVDPSERARRRLALDELTHLAAQTIPELVPADDVSGRISDFTYDIGEHQRAAEDTITRAQALARRHGARTTRSSVHLHFSFDRMDKASGAVAFLASQGVGSARALQRYAFIGDSGNDAPCFAAFRTTLGVANVRGDFSLGPRYLTAGERSQGFIEAAELLTRLRSPAGAR